MSMQQASIIGSGPNGLSAAIVLAQAGYSVDVYEAEEQIGGASRTMPLTLPGFRHDFGSAVHPMAVGSPFFTSLPLEKHGLRWIHSPAAVAHPLDDGTAVMLEEDLSDAVRALEVDGPAWRRMVEPFVRHWPAFAEETLGPVLHLPRHPLLLGRFGLTAWMPSDRFVRTFFKSERTRAIFAGLAAHSFLSLDEPLTAAFGVIFAITAHAGGWPVPAGGSQAIPDALAAQLQELGGRIHSGRPITSLKQLGHGLTLCDITPRQLLSIAEHGLSVSYRKKLEGFVPGPAAFKIDYALSEPIPWRAAECRRAITVHLGGTFEEIARSEDAMARGRVSDKPFLILAQPSLFDPLRAPENRHTAWVYCHVANGSDVDMTEAIESQIERFAPGFRDCVLAKHISSPAALEARDANLIGGDISGGGMTVGQVLFRPSLRQYATSIPNVYLCSSSTPPGAGVHGMCGFHAARMALRHARKV
jgi:phytoene dehydrogenase-like protein